ncbi:MAG: hypothetical protein C5B50_01125 [Verrucomicrobia bacterium]|nr:MAG: hypothetical protein C5B50_01125 [Verrucomicrobiota bacterium]
MACETTRSINRDFRADGICLLTFDRPNSSANILDPAALSEVAEHLAWIEKQSDIKGLVLASAKPSIFIAGADLKLFRSETPLDEVRKYIEQGQQVMNSIAALTMPTVAAIHGAALGGGFEICLACAYRVASIDRTTKIGFPETQLGLIPAWGGPTRLARLIGPDKASEVICRGKILSAQQAFETGLVDELTESKGLIEAAVVACHRSSKARSIVRTDDVRDNGPRQPQRRPGPGDNKAALKAKDVIHRCLALAIPESLALERETFLDLVQTEAAQNLIRLFFLEDRAKKRRILDVREERKPIKRAAVIGAGTMGAGIAHWLSARQVEVALRDVSEAQLTSGMEHIRSVYQADVARGVLTSQEMENSLNHIRSERGESSLSDVDIVVEAVFEELEVKKQIFSRLGQALGPETILATNTSALPISEIAKVAMHPERVIGLHFFNPVHRMSLIEIISGPQTAPEIAQRCLSFTQKIGKLPVLVRDVPGFVANRVLTPYLNEAQRLFESGVPIEELDNAMLDFGFPMGPMRLLDEIGLPVELRIAETLERSFGDRMKVPDCLRSMAAAGAVGRKSGRGYYVYREQGIEIGSPKSNVQSPKSAQSPQSTVHGPQSTVRPLEASGQRSEDRGKRSAPVPNADTANLVRAGGTGRLSAEQIQERLLLVMINEAARCVEEHVVDDSDDVDFVMVKGTGFPAWRGGPLRYAQARGLLPMVE